MKFKRKPYSLIPSFVLLTKVAFNTGENYSIRGYNSFEAKASVEFLSPTTIALRMTDILILFEKAKGEKRIGESSI